MCKFRSLAYVYGNFKDFLNKSTLHGLRVLSLRTPFKYARVVWILFLLAIIVWSHYIIINLVIGYIDAPTEIRKSTNPLHISKSPFPSVAVCSANKFSRRKINEFAEKVFEQQQKYNPYYLAETTHEMAQHLMALRGFYNFPSDKNPFNETVLYRMDKIFTFMFNSTNYPIRDYLKLLAPDCNDIVIRGLIFGEPIDTTTIFKKEMTSSSVCCIFNYKRKSHTGDGMRDVADAFITNSDKIKFEANSILNSVQFVLQTDMDDYTYREFSNDAFQVYIFPQTDYGTIQSNQLGEVLVDHNTIVEIPIQPEFISSTHRIRQFSPSVRHCYFSDEGEKVLNRSYYSLDECLLFCRTSSMIQYCGCVAPPMVGIDTMNFTYCNFMDLTCLKNWNSIWYGWDTFDYVHDIDYGLKVSYKCPHCLPTCNGIDFNIDANDMTLRRTYGPVYSHGILKGLNNSMPLAIIKLYFLSRYFEATEMDIVGDWVVLLNRFGGIMSLMYGFSIISYIEIAYYSLVFYFLKWKTKQNTKMSTKSKSTAVVSEYNKKDEFPPLYSLYWNELQLKQSVHIKEFQNKWPYMKGIQMNQSNI